MLGVNIINQRIAVAVMLNHFAFLQIRQGYQYIILGMDLQDSCFHRSK